MSEPLGRVRIETVLGRVVNAIRRVGLDQRPDRLQPALERRGSVGSGRAAAQAFEPGVSWVPTCNAGGFRQPRARPLRLRIARELGPRA